MADGTAVADAPDDVAEEKPLSVAEQILAEEDKPGDIEIRDSADSSITIPARYGFDGKQIEAIRQTVAKDCTLPELVMFLEICARYELDPFAKQIFAAKMGGAVQIIVGRDGLLAHAHKQADFVKMTSDVVRAEDTFEVEWEDGDITKMRHAYKGFGERGEIVGAWAMAEREGHGRTYFFAPFAEYKGQNTWNKNPSAMIVKVPESYVLRKAWSISGVVGEEEVAYKRAGANEIAATPEEPEYGPNEALAERLQSLFEEANTVVPGSYRPQKMVTMLAGQDEEGRLQIAEGLEGFIAKHKPVEEEVTDAVVVDDDGDKDETPAEGDDSPAEGKKASA